MRVRPAVATAPVMQALAPEARRLAVLTATAYLLMLVVVAVSAYIRVAGHAGASDGVAFARGLHRAAASLTALVVLAMAILVAVRPALRVRSAMPVAAALILTLALSALGALSGVSPPPPAAFGNLFGGLCLATLLAWIHGRVSREHGASAAPVAAAAHRQLALAVFIFALLQALLGGWMASFVWRDPGYVLIVHIVTGLAASALAGLLGMRAARDGDARGYALIALAAVSTACGISAALFDLPPALAIAHPLAITLLLAALVRQRFAA